MRRPPRLVARTLAVTFITVAVILSLVFIVLMVDARRRVRAAEIENLSVAERVFTALEARRQQEQLAAIATMAENPTLKAALDTYFTESRFAGLPADQEISLRNTVTVEAEKLAALTRADVLAILDTTGHVFASAGSSRERWPLNELIMIPAGGSSTFQDIAVLPTGAFRISGAALSLGDRDVGTLVIGATMDANYARELSRLASADVVITVDGNVIASTAPRNVAADLVNAGTAAGETRTLSGEEYAIRTLLSSGPVRIYTLDRSTPRRARRHAMRCWPSPAWPSAPSYLPRSAASGWRGR